MNTKKLTEMLKEFCDDNNISDIRLEYLNSKSQTLITDYNKKQV